MQSTCLPKAVETIMPQGRGARDMYDKGMKRIDVFVTPERKDKVVQLCQQRGITQTQLVNTLLTKELSEFNPNPANGAGHGNHTI